MKKEFNEFRFAGLQMEDQSNKYLTMKRVNEDETKIVVKISSDNLIETQYGYALILDATRVVFIKSWQVSINWFGTEVLLQKEYFNVKVWGNHTEFEENDNNCSWETWVEAAKKQNTFENRVMWEK